jgi:hypothetical protein
MAWACESVNGLMVEGNNLVWINHLTRLFRCAPEHVRHLSTDEEQSVSEQDRAMFHLPDRSGNGVFQFRELSQQESASSPNTLTNNSPPVPE